jgi:biopolymer transport protein ExbD
MKSKHLLKLGLSLAMIVALSFVSFKSFAHKNEKTLATQDTNVIITIDKTTTSDEFKDIKNMLNENGITATFTNIEHNDLNELTGLKIELKDDNNGSAASRISSNMPITQITFGRKDGLLFISQGKTEQGAFGFFNQPNMFPFGFENDSIMSPNFQSFGNFNFNDFFNDEDNSFFLNGKNLTIDELREQMKKQLQSSGMNSNGLSWFFDSQDDSNHTFNFIDNPDIEKLIIIDGKEADFTTLKSLEQNNQIKEVDILKPKTAMSLYGDKGKDGAIIVSTK